MEHGPCSARVARGTPTRYHQLVARISPHNSPQPTWTNEPESVYTILDTQDAGESLLILAHNIVSIIYDMPSALFGATHMTCT